MATNLVRSRTALARWSLGAIPVAVLVAIAAWPALASGQTTTTTTTASTPESAKAACAQGDALTTNAQYEDAATAYAEAVAADPTLSCIGRGYASLRIAQSDGLCRQAHALSDQGKDDEAEKLYIQALTLRPSSPCAAAGLKPSRTESDKDFLDRIGSPADVASKAVALIGKYLGLILGALVVLCILGLIIAVAGRLRRVNVEIQAIGDGSVDDSKKVGTALTALMKEKFIRDTRPDSEGGNPTNAVDLVAAPEDLGAAIDKLSAVSPRFGFIGGIVSFLEAFVPMRRFQVSGETLPGSRSDAKIGLSLLFQQQGRAADATDIWKSRDLPLPTPPGANEHLFWLAQAGAAWIQFRLAWQLNPDSQPPSDFFRSYLYAFAGATALGSDHDSVSGLFLKALELDPTNWSAKATLALHYARDRDDYAAAMRLFDRTLCQLRTEDANRGRPEDG